MNYNNIWQFGYSKRYYLTHPWKWIEEAALNIQAAWQRATRGWADRDTWNMDTWFLHTIPQMLRHLAQHSCGYPGEPPFDGDDGAERWKDWLLETAALLDTGLEDWQDAHNEYEEEYTKYLMDNWKPPTKDENGLLVHESPEFTEFEEKFFERVRELRIQGEKNVHEAFDRISKFFWFLWD